MKFFQKNFTTLLLLIFFYIKVHTLYFKDINYHPYITNEWLINYEGGFVRRGLIGQIIIFLARNFSIEPWTFVFVGQLMAYIFILYFAAKKIRSNLNVFGWIFVISPVTFLFDIYDPGGLGRKELIFLAFLAWNANYLKILNEKKCDFSSLYYIGLSIALFFGVLIHEIFIFYYPLLILQTACFGKLKFRRLVIAPIVASIVGLVLVILHKGSISVRDSILYSWRPMVPSIGCNPDHGAICYLGKTTEAALHDVLVPDVLRLIIIPVLIILFYSMVFLLAQGRVIHNNLDSSGKKIVLCWFFSILAIIPLFIFGIDYGRWVHAYLLGLFFSAPICVFGERVNFIRDEVLNFALALIIVIGSISWNISHTRSQSLGFGLLSYSTSKIKLMRLP